MIKVIKLLIFLLWTVSWGWSTIILAYFNITGQVAFNALVWAIFLGANWLGYKCTKNSVRRILRCR
jgi:hypothetical protein